MDTTKTTTHLGLCAGYGGIELGLKRVIPDLRTVALCEIEAYACANLVAKMEAGLMDAAPIWTDLKTFPWSEFCDRVDILTGGYPCQPFSAAGKRLGTEDPRHLWPFIADGIRILRPRICMFENVEGHISLGLREVIAELGSLGYEVSWGIFSASEVGAPHQRKRIFILAHRNDARLQRAISESIQRTSGKSLRHNDDELANSDNCGGREDQLCSELRTSGSQQSSGGAWLRSEPAQAGEITLWPSRPGQPQHSWEPPRVVGNAKSWEDNGRESGDMGEASGQWGCGNDASDGSGEDVADDYCQHARHEAQRPERESRDLSCRSGEDLGDASSSRYQRKTRISSECAQGKSIGYLAESDGTMGNTNSPRPQERQGQRGAGIQGIDSDGGEDADRQAEPSLGGDSHGTTRGMGYAELCISCDNRTDELRLLGNGVVPATAELAFRTLLKELTQ